MSYLHAAILGLVQGLGEFLPISSSAHLVLVPWLFKWDYQGLDYDVALHLGTLVAVCAYFWEDWMELLKAGLSTAESAQRRIFWAIVLATVPAAWPGSCWSTASKRTSILRRHRLDLGGVVLWACGSAWVVPNLGPERAWQCAQRPRLSLYQWAWCGEEPDPCLCLFPARREPGQFGSTVEWERHRSQTDGGAEARGSASGRWMETRLAPS